MKLEPSNLGQLIGRLMAEHADRGEEARPQPPTAARKRGVREQQVMELVTKMGEVRCADLVAALGITAGHAYVLLSRLRREGSLVRGSGAARYVLA